MQPTFAQIRALGNRLKIEVLAIYLATQDPRVSLAPRLLAIGVVAYAVSPIDFIPDFVPILGYVDDAILVPLGILLVLRMIPAIVMEECREDAADKDLPIPGGGVAAGLIICFWVALLVLFAIEVWPGTAADSDT
jgi:uncharacterized membrane protein YkvA (DUF1232 family)